MSATNCLVNGVDRGDWFFCVKRHKTTPRAHRGSRATGSLWNSRVREVKQQEQGDPPHHPRACVLADVRARVPTWPTPPRVM